MVQATATRESVIGEVLGNSLWLQVHGEAQAKWSEAEGQIALDMLRKLFEEIEEPDVFVITSFRLVAQNPRRRIQDSAPISHLVPRPVSRWTLDRVGTIHTFQGKEAEAVILVLGAPQDASAGARCWAGRSPNLLNVAVSRAKRRLYVIGNHEAWKNAGAFRVLSSSIRIQPAFSSTGDRPENLSS